MKSIEDTLAEIDDGLARLEESIKVARNYGGPGDVACLVAVRKSLRDLKAWILEL